MIEAERSGDVTDYDSPRDITLFGIIYGAVCANAGR